VLLDESVLTVSEDGRVTTTANYAIRVLRREGRGFARADVSYEPDTDKVKRAACLLIRGEGQV